MSAVMKMSSSLENVNETYLKRGVAIVCVGFVMGSLGFEPRTNGDVSHNFPFFSQKT